MEKVKHTRQTSCRWILRTINISSCDEF